MCARNFLAELLEQIKPCSVPAGTVVHTCSKELCAVHLNPMHLHCNKDLNFILGLDPCEYSFQLFVL